MDGQGSPGDIHPKEGIDSKADPLVAEGARLLKLWAEDHGVYLLYKFAAEDFRLLPEARALPLTDAFRREVLLPFAAVLRRGQPLDPGEIVASGTADRGRTRRSKSRRRKCCWPPWPVARAFRCAAGRWIVRQRASLACYCIGYRSAPYPMDH